MSHPPQAFAVRSASLGLIRGLVPGLLLAWLAPALAQAPAASQVYRCGPGQYSATPCPGGTPIDGDARTAEQQAQARDTARRQQQLADELRQERLQREQAAVGQGPAAIKPAPRASAADAKPRSRSKPKTEPKPWPPRRPPLPRPPQAAPAASGAQR